MTTQELRLGNHVNFSVSNGITRVFGERGVITGIAEDYVYVNGIKFDVGSLVGVKLTDEILFDRCNANKPTESLMIEGNYHFIKNNIGFYVCVQMGNGYANEGKVLILIHGIPYISVDCLYLHQLQNLYFALTGEELKITLPK